MTKEDVLNGLKEVIAVIRPHTDLSHVTFDSDLIQDLGIDSLTMMLLALASEEKFQVRFPDGQPLPKTVGEVCDRIIALKGK